MTRLAVQVDYYGAPTPVRQMANVSAPESSLLVIQPYDKSSIPAIERGIMQSDLALTPNSDGNVIRLNIPQLTAVHSPGCIPSGSARGAAYLSAPLTQEVCVESSRVCITCQTALHDVR